MAREFALPDLGEGITEAQIIRVLIKEGDDVAEDQYIVEVETDKAAVEIPSPYSGVARQVHVQEGQTINVGDVIVTFDDGKGAVAASKVSGAGAPAATAALQGASSPAVAVAKKPAPPPRPALKTTVAAAPAVRKFARELGVELDAVTGTGPGGRITKEDVELRARVPAPADRAPGRTGRRPAAPPPGIADADKWGPIRREPLNQIRKTIAGRVSQSAFTVPHVTHMDEADITELERMRRGWNDIANNDTKLTMMSFVIRATCLALRKYPIFNASFDKDGGQIIYKEYVNMGIAVDTERGLIVPVIRNADKLGLRSIAAELRSIADRIRANQFAIEDLRGGSFTITNVGALGGLFSTPIINYPEAAILALGRSRRVPVVRNAEVVQALMLPVSVSFDHRATDGANAARFTREIISYLETPAKFLLD